MEVLDLIVVALFVSQVLEVWHHGSIFEDVRARMEAGFFGDPGSFHIRLLSCMFCLTVWVVGATLGLFHLASVTPAYVGNSIHFLIYCGAIARLANIIHDLVRPWSRTPNSHARAENSQPRR